MRGQLRVGLLNNGWEARPISMGGNTIVCAY